MVFVTNLFAGYVIVLKNGRKIYSSTPFEFKENGVYVTLPSDMVLFIKKKDIDYEATRAFIKKLKERKKKSAAGRNVVARESQSKEPDVQQATESPKGKPADEKLPTGNQTVKTTVPAEKPIVKPRIKPEDQTKPVDKTSSAKVDRLKPDTTTPPDLTKKEPGHKTGSALTKSRSSFKEDYGLSIASMKKADLTLEDLIEKAKRVKWVYEGKCPLCGGTGKSVLSTPTNPVVCTYCNGTGKSGAWNDEYLKIGDDCPWCVLGYDELSKGPCRHCMGTGRYLGLEKLGFLLDVDREEKISDDLQKEVAK